MDFTGNIFETVLQRIENNSSICSNDITTKIESELREYSSTRLDEINYSNGSIQREKCFLNLNYKEEIRLLNSNYIKEIQLLDSNYNEEIRLLDLNYSKEVRLLDSNYIKEIQNLFLQRSGLESEYDRKCREVQSNMEWKKSSLEVEYDRKCREVQSSMERKKSDLKSKYDSEFSKAECFMTSKKLDCENKLKKLDQERNSIQHIRHECDRWKESGLDINYVFKVQDDSNHSSKEYTLLHFAANFGDINVTKLLFAEGAGVDVKDQNGNTPLHLATANNNIDVVKLLVEKGANINEKDNNGNAPLHLAAVKGHIGMVQLLVEKGANINEKDNNGNAPLHLATVKGHIGIVQLLVEKGANIYLMDKDGNTSLYIAFYKNYHEMVQYLTKKEPNMKAYVDSLVRYIVENRTHTLLKGRTPLHLAAIYNCTEVYVESLLAKGENSLSKDANGKTPRELATDEGLIQLFREAEIKQQEYNATKWSLVGGGSAAALGITVAATLFATAVFTAGLLNIVTAVAAVMTLALAVSCITYITLKPSAKIRESRIECEATIPAKSSFIEV